MGTPEQLLYGVTPPVNASLISRSPSEAPEGLGESIPTPTLFSELISWRLERLSQCLSCSCPSTSLLFPLICQRRRTGVWHELGPALFPTCTLGSQVVNT